MTTRWLIGILLVLALTACQSEAGVVSPSKPGSQDEGIVPESSPLLDDTPEDVTPTALPESYPAPKLLATDTPLEGYPPPPTIAPAVDAYPVDELIWIIRPVGEQCAEANANSYVDIQEAVAALAAAGVPFDAAETTELTVCQACGCPTSTHYRARISSTNLERATALGWVKESEG